MSLLNRVRDCHRFDPSHFRPFLIGAAQVGWIKPGFAERLRAFPTVFAVEAAAVRLASGVDGFAARSRAVEEVLRRLQEEDGLFAGWRDEAFPVATRFDAAPLMQIERAAVSLFGVRAYGVHVNGLVETGDTLQLWVGRRSRTKQTEPGKLDHIVAGGQPVGISLRDNLLKEGAEEADIPAALMRRARSVGVFAYRLETEEGVRNDVLFNYDLRLPAEFVPRNTDGEIEEFFLWPVERVRQVIAETEDFKFNVAAVNIDFLVRYGVIAPEDPDYFDILAALHAAGL